MGLIEGLGKGFALQRGCRDCIGILGRCKEGLLYTG